MTGGDLPIDPCGKSTTRSLLELEKLYYINSANIMNKVRGKLNP